MRDERLILSLFAPKNLCGGWTVNRSEARTTIILDRYENHNSHIHFYLLCD